MGAGVNVDNRRAVTLYCGVRSSQVGNFASQETLIKIT